MSSNVDGQAGQAVDAALAGFTTVLSDLTTYANSPEPTGAADSALIDQIAVLEQVKAAAAAAQHTAMVAFARSQVDTHLAHADAGDIDPAAVGRGIGDQIALACRISPFHGSRRLGVARALAVDLSMTRALLAAGRISEQLAETVVAETRHLDPEHRRAVDKLLADGGLADLSPYRAAALARKCAYEIDPAGYLARGRTARADRRVGLRPAPDTMSVFTGFLPVEQGVACLAALRAHTDTIIGAGDGRSRDQIMADTLVERLTGQTTATDVNVEVGIVIPVDALLDPDHGGTAEIVGQGPVPVGIARDLLAATTGRRWWRRLFTAPGGGPLIGCDPRRRRFDGALAHLITVRDHGRCRDPFCDAPIRRARPPRPGTPTSAHPDQHPDR